LRKCEKLSARMIEKVAPSAAWRLAVPRLSLLSADKLVLMISLLRDRRRSRGHLGGRLSELRR
jgi:hypothetical protein